MSMFDVTRVSADIGDSQISFETGKLAKQAGGAVVVQAGDTMVLCTATVGNLRDVDFLPLTVDIEERMYAAGKIPGSFFRREGKSSEKATLTARMIDRPIRPALPQGLALRDPARRDPDVGGPGPPLRHPRDERRLRGAGDLPGPRRRPRRRGADRQARRRLRRQPRRGGPRRARPRPDRRRHRRGDPDGRGRRQRRHRAGDPRRARHRPRRDQEARRRDGGAAAEGRQGEDRGRGPEDRRGPARARSAPPTARRWSTRSPPRASSSATRRSTRSRTRWSPSTRPSPTTARPTRSAWPRSRPPSARSRRTRSARRSPSTRSAPTAAPRTRSGRSSARSTSRPRVHGSALFTRGETQILSNAALGTTRMDMRIDTLGLETSKKFWHHYNFPPFSVGEAGFMRGPKRRDIGHGALAERALVATIPDEEDFPYVIRVVSETLESNGSSSMGSVCASSMALQAAGVPVTRTGRRRRDGADQGGRRLHRPHRHRRRRGPPRRHGLQGRRHRGRDHRPADGHQDHRRHLRDPHRRAGAGQQGPPVHPRQDGRGDRRPARAALPARAADRVDQDRPGEDRRRDRQGRRNHPRPLRGVRSRNRRRGRRHDPDLRPDRRRWSKPASRGSSR